jgi:excisionase family DNA binding protein
LGDATTAVTEYLTVAETAVILARSQQTVRGWIRTGRLAAVRDPGHGVLVPIAALRALEPVVVKET